MAILYVWNGHSGTNSGTKANPYNASTGIQTALNAASAGDTILVHKGEGPYTANIDFNTDGTNNNITLMRWKPNSGRPVIDGELVDGASYGFQIGVISGKAGTSGVYTIVGFEIKNIRGLGPGNGYAAIFSSQRNAAHLAHLYIHDCDKGFRNNGVGGSDRYSTVVSCIMKDINDIGFWLDGNVKVHNCIAVRVLSYGFYNSAPNNSFIEFRHCLAIDCGHGNTSGVRIPMYLAGDGGTFVFNCVISNSGTGVQPDYSIYGDTGDLTKHFYNYCYSDKGWAEKAIGNATQDNANRTENLIDASSGSPVETISFVSRFVTQSLSMSLRENFRLRSDSPLINSASALPECLLDFDMIPRGHRNPGSGSVIFPEGPRINRGPSSLFDYKPLYSTYQNESGTTPQYSGMWGSSSFAVRFGANSGTSPPLADWLGGTDSDYIDITPAVKGVYNSNWSFFCWMLGGAVSATDVNHRSILAVHSSGSAGGENYLDDRFVFFIESPNDGDYGNMLRIQTHEHQYHGEPSTEVWDETGAHTWHHVGFTVNLTGSSSNPQIKLYLDGQLETTINNPASSISLTVNQSDFMILGSQYEAGFYHYMRFYLGQGNHDAVDMSDATIWSSAFDAEEISELYNSGVPWDVAQHSKFKTKCVAYYRLGDGDTINESKMPRYNSLDGIPKQDIIDVSGHNYHGGTNNMQSGGIELLFREHPSGTLYHYRSHLLGCVVPNSNFKLVDVGPFEYNHELPLFQGERHVSIINGVPFTNADGGEDYHRSVGKFMGVETRPFRRFEQAGKLYTISTGSKPSYDQSAG
jgi:hypothetical protein